MITRSATPYTYEPGQTITVSFKEFVPHPSYFRFAFATNSDSEFKEPASILPIDKNRPCPIDTGDKCGASDYYNNSAVLPGMDNLDPHLAGAVKTWTYQVKLPDVECTNCTLQIIQVMEDNNLHGDYNPVPNSPGDSFYIPDIYHQCIDIVLKRSNTGTGGSGGTTATGGTGGTAGNPPGCACAVPEKASNSALVSALLFAVGAIAFKQRRRASS